MVLLGAQLDVEFSWCSHISKCHSRASDNGPELVNWAGSDGGGLRAAGDTTAGLLAGLFCSCQNCVPLSQTSPRRSCNEPGRSGTGRVSANPCGNLGQLVSLAVVVGQAGLLVVVGWDFAHGCWGFADCA